MSAPSRPSPVPCRRQWNVTRPEGTRRFWVRFPASYNASTDYHYPLLFALHGLGDTCEDFGPATGFSQLSDNSTRPFIYIYPCGWPGLLGETDDNQQTSQLASSC